MHFLITALDGSKSDRILFPAVIRLGRDPSCEVAFDAEAYAKVSWEHARIDRTPTAWILTHLSDTNKTLLNDQPIDGPVPLRVGDRIRLGYTGPTIEILAIPPPAKAPAAPSSAQDQPPRPAVPLVAPLPAAQPNHEPHRPLPDVQPLDDDPDAGQGTGFGNSTLGSGKPFAPRPKRSFSSKNMMMIVLGLSLHLLATTMCLGYLGVIRNPFAK